MVVICEAMRPVYGPISGIPGIAMFAGVFRPLPAWRSLWVYSATSAALALAMLVMVAADEEFHWFVGPWQRLLIVIIHGWFMVIGVQRLGRAGGLTPGLRLQQ
jgi:hypothetical protein